MKLVIIFGPQAVGKMTVGKYLAKKSGYKLLHNHISIEVALQFFEWGSLEFRELDSTIRNKILELLKSSNKQAIFTFTWGLNLESDHKYIQQLVEKYADEVYYVELTASLATRLQRNGLMDRLTAKPSKKNVAFSESLIRESEEKYIFNTANDFPYQNHIVIDTEIHSPAECADIILQNFPNLLLS